MENRVAEQIRFYRKQKGLTQEQMAEAMGVSVAAVSKWEQGVVPSRFMRKFICRLRLSEVSRQ